MRDCVHPSTRRCKGDSLYSVFSVSSCARPKQLVVAPEQAPLGSLAINAEVLREHLVAQKLGKGAGP